MASRSLGQLTLDLVAKTGMFEKGLDRAGRKMSETERKAHAFGKALGASVAVGAGIAAAAFGIYIKNTIEAEKVQAQLAARIKDTGGAAGRTVEQLGKMADKLQGLTIFDDEAIGSAQALLLTFTQIQGVNFDRATEAVTDLATVMGTDLDSAAKVVGKSLADPIAGLTALKKAGVVFNDEQKKLVKNMVETGRAAEAQGVILDVLDSKMGSAAEAARNTLGGALQGLQNDFDNLLEGDSGSAGVKGTTQAINEFAATLRSPEVKAGIDSLARGLATLLNLYVKGSAAALDFAQKASAVAGISGPAQGQSNKELQLRKSSLTGQLGRLSEGDSDAIRTAKVLYQTGDIESVKRQIKKDIAEIDAALNVGFYADPANATSKRGRGAPRRPLPPPTGLGILPVATSSSRSGGGGGRAAKDTSIEDEARKNQEAFEKQQEAAEDFRATLEQLRAEIGGPLAQVTLEYTQKEDELAKKIAEGAISAEDAKEAYELLEAQRLKEVEAIQAQKTPMQELLEDLQFENSLMKMNNEERMFAIQTRGMETEEVKKYGDAIRAANEDLENSAKVAEGMDVLRNSTKGLFQDLMSGAKSAKEAFSDFLDSVLAGIAEIIAQQLTQQLFGDMGSSGGGSSTGGFFASLFGSLFGGGMAVGGSTKAGMFYQVNENGPELLSVAGKDYLMMGNKSGTVTPNHSISGGGNTGRPITIINNMPPNTERRSAQQIAQRTQEKLRTATMRNV